MPCPAGRDKLGRPQYHLPEPRGRLSVEVVYHAFYAVLHQWYIPVQKESELKIGKFKIS